MKSLIVLVMLTACAASPQDLSGKMFTFPQQTNKAHVKLMTSQQAFSSVTVCHRSFTDLKRGHSLFSLATHANANAFLIFWDETPKEIAPHIGEFKVGYGGLDYKRNMWHSICTTWDSQSGLVQVWLDGQPSIRKYATVQNISGPVNIVLGQEQDSHGGGFDIQQCFIGMMSDVHMWDYTLSPCEIQNYIDELSFTPGNVLNWRALDFQIVDKVLIENKQTVCH